MFTGLSAFPITPLAHDAVDESSFTRLVERLDDAKVDSITALGSTGSYAYLSSDERSRVARLAVQHAGETPVIVGIGALRTSQVLTNAENAERAGASALLLAPMTYQPLPMTTCSNFSGRSQPTRRCPSSFMTTPALRTSPSAPSSTAASPNCPASLPSKSQGSRLTRSRRGPGSMKSGRLSQHVTIGVSGDAHAAAGLAAGCDAWYSVIGGTLPVLAMKITQAAQERRYSDARTESERLAPLWKLYAEFGGSIRVVAAIAEHLGWAPKACLPLPIQGLTKDQRDRVAGVIDALGLH